MIAVFASGEGTNFEALKRKFADEVGFLVCNVENAKVLERAKSLGVPILLVPHRSFTRRSSHEEAFLTELSKECLERYPQKNLTLIVLAGYMRVLSDSFFERVQELFPGVSIINLHPSALDIYKGPLGYEFSVNNRLPYMELSVHKVTEVLDSGELLASVSVPIFPYDSVVTLQNRAKHQEAALLVSCVQKFLCSFETKKLPSLKSFKIEVSSHGEDV
jgi:phosphoribosylglycinamide formyltransferase 1